MNDIRHKFFNERPEGLEEFVIQAIGSKSMEWKVDFLFTILRKNNYREVLCWAYYFGIPRSKWPRDAEKFYDKYRSDTIEFKKRLESKYVQYVPEDIRIDCEFFGRKYELEMIATPAGLDAFMKQFRNNIPEVMGIDCEAGTVATGTNSKATLLQLATEEDLYLIDVYALKDKIDESKWKEFFELIFHPSILKIGFAFVSDYMFLVNAFPMLSSLFEKPENSVLCLSRLVQSIMIDMEAEKVIFDDVRIPTNLSLMDVSDAILGVKLDKGLQSCNWSQRPLSMDQMTYAITDALATLLIERKITEKLMRGLGKEEAEKIITFSHITYVSRPADCPPQESPQKSSAAFSDIIATVRILNEDIKMCEEHYTPEDKIFVPDAPFFNFIAVLHNLGLNAIDVRVDHPSRPTREQIKDIREAMANNDNAVLITTERRMSNFENIPKDRILIMPTTGNFIALHFIKRIMMQLCLVIDPSYFFTRCEKCGKKNLGNIPAPIYRLIFIMNSMVKKNSVLFRTSFEDVRQAVLEVRDLNPEDYGSRTMDVTVVKTREEIPEVYFDFGSFKIKPFNSSLIKTDEEENCTESFPLKLTEKNVAISAHVKHLLVCLDCGHVYPKIDSKEVEGIIINVKSFNISENIMDIDEQLDTRIEICSIIKEIIPAVEEMDINY